MLEESDDPKTDHVDHGCVAGHEKEKRELHGVFFGQVTWLYLVATLLSKANFQQLGSRRGRNETEGKVKEPTCSTTSLLIKSSCGLRLLCSTKLAR